MSSKSSSGSRDSYSPASKYVSALTRSLPLVSPFQGCLKEVSGSPLAVSRPPVVPHQPLQPPRHDQYEISGLDEILNGLGALCTKQKSLFPSNDPALRICFFDHQPGF
ncbi:MAG: hypothetical protein QE493_04015 [Verrucomicrobiae bacterium]|nr:hypothetical protein [Verrucomicrobiae bacterium]